MTSQTQDCLPATAALFSAAQNFPCWQKQKQKQKQKHLEMVSSSSHLRRPFSRASHASSPACQHCTSISRDGLVSGTSDTAGHDRTSPCAGDMDSTIGPAKCDAGTALCRFPSALASAHVRCSAGHSPSCLRLRWQDPRQRCGVCSERPRSRCSGKGSEGARWLQVRMARMLGA